MVKSDPPVTFISTPLAPSIVASTNGESIAASIAFWARLSPSASPTPIRADPALLITDLMSAKSRFMRPGTVIKSAIALVPLFKTESAILKASSRVDLSVTTSITFWLGITIKVSTLFLS